MESFQRGEIPFTAIAEVVERVLTRHAPAGGPLTIEAVAEADAWARGAAAQTISGLARSRASRG